MAARFELVILLRVHLSEKLSDQFLAGWLAGWLTVGPDPPQLRSSIRPARELADIIRLGGYDAPQMVRIQQVLSADSGPCWL
jgi:hypothetical protein